MADAFQFSGDYYSLPNLVPLLSPPVEAGTADGDHGVPAADPQVGLSGSQVNRSLRPTARAYKPASLRSWSLKRTW